jgi:hypothetical protein
MKILIFIAYLFLIHMKKRILFLVALLMTFCAQAQITLDSSSVGNIGDIFYLGVDTEFDASFSIGNPGTNQTWDFSQLNQDDYDTLFIVDPSSTPYGADFPNANRAVEQGTGTGAYAYFVLSADSFNLLGVAADPFQTGSPFIVRQNPPVASGVFPFTYGGTFNSNSTYTVTLEGAAVGAPVDSIRLTSNSIRDVVCDGWGDLILWSGTFPSLRTKEIVTTHDQIEILFFGIWSPFQDTTYTDSTFRWNDNTKGYTLAEASYIGGVLDDITYVDPNPVAISPAYLHAIQVFPNPATERVIVQTELSEVKTVELYSLQGQLLRSMPITGLRTEVDLEGIAPGVVLLKAIDQQGLTLRSQKLIVR